MDPGLQSLLLCTDDKVVRVLRRVLSELEIGVEQVSDVETAMQRLTRQRFEAIIVDCETPEIASRMLKGIRLSPVNQRAISVAIIDGQGELKGAFELGAHFVLFKPISLERTKSSFRSVRALMKRERRRHTRVPVEIPVEVIFESGTGSVRTVTSDLGEHGMAIKSKNFKLPSLFSLQFTLPGGSSDIRCKGEVAWEGKAVLGVRFRNVPAESSEQLKAWVARQVHGIDVDDAPVSCKLTDLSLSACYLQTESPFPVRTRLQLMMKVGAAKLQVEGIVRVMHPGAGMGIEFTQRTDTQKTRVAEFIQTLVNNSGVVPDLQVRPDTIDNSAEAFSSGKLGGDWSDPLLALFHTKADVAAEIFQAELRRQRGVPEEVGV